MSEPDPLPPETAKTETPVPPQELGAEALDDAALASEQGASAQAAELAALRAKIADLQDQALRAQAEAQNARRRANDEIAKVRKFALESFAESLLPVIDSLEAALAVENASAEQLREGTVATHQQLMGVLARNQVTEINPAPGARFDPAQQHAIIAVADSGHEAGTVVAVLQKGYLIADRVLRPALVTVAQSG